jgi:hypothetical protein
LSTVSKDRKQYYSHSVQIEGKSAGLVEESWGSLLKRKRRKENSLTKEDTICDLMSQMRKNRNWEYRDKGWLVQVEENGSVRNPSQCPLPCVILLSFLFRITTKPLCNTVFSSYVDHVRLCLMSKIIMLFVYTICGCV